MSQQMSSGTGPGVEPEQDPRQGPVQDPQMRGEAGAEAGGAPDSGSAPDSGGATDSERRDLRFGLEEALDGELPADVVARMTEHAEGCPECAAEFARLRAMKDLVRRCCQAETAPATLRERISVQYRRLEVEHGPDGATFRSTTYRRTEFG
ncbi:zf-HC2 domain-containing protein [Brachybacterium endophyticum]|uniref:zf-HC2 domain-containing protein n=1 Tax=Brachybacterium endophyticum TaxID=2182385 RepID=UPI00196B614E|nr:zf-HC2 domain-containing protein [Brachybacterium endophyticum]